jgi:hypothetical protein
MPITQTSNNNNNATTSKVDVRLFLNHICQLMRSISNDIIFSSNEN